MSLSFVAGIVGGLISVLVVHLILKKRMGKKYDYDERQVAARGVAFRAGFLTFVGCNLAVSCIEFATERTLVFFAPGLSGAVIIILSVLVFVEVAIFKDAYFSQGNSFSRTWCALEILLSVIFIILGVFWDEVRSRVLYFAAGGFGLVVIASILVKNQLAKKANEAE